MRLFFDLGELSLGSLGKGKTGKKGKLGGKNFLALFNQTQQKGQMTGLTLGKVEGKPGKTTGLGLMSEKTFNLPREDQAKGKQLKLLTQNGEVTLLKAKAKQTNGAEQPKLVKGEKGWMIRNDKASSLKQAETSEEGALELKDAAKLKQKKGAKGSVETDPLKIDVAAVPKEPSEKPLIVETGPAKKGKNAPSKVEVVEEAANAATALTKGKGKTKASAAQTGAAQPDKQAVLSDAPGQASQVTTKVAAGKAGVVSAAVAGEVKQTSKKVLSKQLLDPEKPVKQASDQTENADAKGSGESKQVPTKAPSKAKGEQQQQTTSESPLKLGNETQNVGKRGEKITGAGDQAGKTMPFSKPVTRGNVEHTPAAQKEVPRPHPAAAQRGEVPTPIVPGSIPTHEVPLPSLHKSTVKHQQAESSPFLKRQPTSQQQGENALFSDKKAQAQTRFQPVQKMPSSKMASWIAAHRESLQANKVEITAVQHEAGVGKARPDLNQLVRGSIEKTSIKLPQNQKAATPVGKADVQQPVAEQGVKLAEMQAKEPNKTVLVNSLSADAKSKNSKKMAAAANHTAAKATTVKQGPQPTMAQAVVNQGEVEAVPAFAAQKQTVITPTGEQQVPEHMSKLGVEDRSLTSAMDKAQAKASLGSLRGSGNETSVATSQQGVHQSAMSADIPRDAEGLPQPMFRDLEAELAKAVRIRPNAVTLKLNPQELGEVRIRVIRRGEQLQAKIQAENPQTADLILENQSKLDERLREQGIEISQFDVMTGGGSAGGFDQGQSGWERQAEYAMRADVVAGDPWGRVSESESERAAVHEAADHEAIAESDPAELEHVDLEGEALTYKATEVETTV